MLVIGTFWLIEMFVEEIRMNVIYLNELTEDAKDNLVEMKQIFNQIIQNSSDVRQLSEKSIFFGVEIDMAMKNAILLLIFRVVGAFNGIFEINITNLFMWALITITTLMISFLLELVKSTQRTFSIEIICILYNRLMYFFLLFSHQHLAAICCKSRGMARIQLNLSESYFLVSCRLFSYFLRELKFNGKPEITVGNGNNRSICLNNICHGCCSCRFSQKKMIHSLCRLPLFCLDEDISRHSHLDETLIVMVIFLCVFLVVNLVKC